MYLVTKMKELKVMMDEGDEAIAQELGEPALEVHALGDVTTEDFKINRGENKTQRVTDPFNEARMAKILKAIEIGPDLTTEQRKKVEDLIKEYADIFALTLSEVFYVDWHKHTITIDPDAKLPKRMAQRPITEQQKAWFYNILDEMEESHVIQKVPGEFLKNLASTNLAPKEAGKLGMMKTDVLRKVNRECIANGLPPYWEELAEADAAEGRVMETIDDSSPPVQTKWRVCHAFTALNRMTQVPPFPQGDLKAKQQFAAGHRWGSVIDFAAGYYAVPIADESVPYIGFYVEGRGYYVYLRMPLGLTGAPATFCEMVSIALEDMIGRELVNWMDDIFLPGDDFNTKLNSLRKFFTRCHDRKLSLAPSKCKFFFTELFFAGAIVGPGGVKLNWDKVAAVIDWQPPKDVKDLMSFLGLTNFFRRHINDYARIARPLTDVTRNVQMEIPKAGWKARKGAYKRALENTSLGGKWGNAQQEAFLKLKILLTTEPILRPPQYDGRRFRVTTDGCKDGFAGWLQQEFEHTDKHGKTHKMWHPISFCSKRTSPSESKYEPFLLEFAALKYSLDEFDPMIYGSPIEIETDCQALRDLLIRDKQSSHHSRWEESVLARQIVDIRHRPGIENPVANAISRKWRNRPHVPGDGSSWTVQPDWDQRQGVKNDVMQVTAESTHQHEVLTRYADDVFFRPITQHLLGLNSGDSPQDRRRAAHRATGFMIENGKLWRISTRATDRTPKTECIPSSEAFDLARRHHEDRGHFGHEHGKLSLRDSFFWPGMDTDTRRVIIECPQCKSFGTPHLNALLQPVCRRQPFDLIAGDYVSLPKGKGGYKTLGVYIDTGPEAKVCRNG